MPHTCAARSRAYTRSTALANENAYKPLLIFGPRPNISVYTSNTSYLFAQAMHQPFGLIVPVTIEQCFGALKKRHPEHFWPFGLG